MPSCRVTNKTGQPLNICLKQVAALHFENTVKSGDEVKFKPGRVWFTLEAQVDDGSKDTRYSVIKSAATIGLLAVAVGAVTATAGAALLPTTATAGAAAGAAAAGSYLSKAGFVARTALIKNAGTIGKISSVAVPKAVEKISSEVGGLSALQKEVLSIVASPTLSTDVRTKATHMLKSLYGAYTVGKTAPPPTSASALGTPSSTATNPATTREAQNLSNELDAAHAESHIESVPVQTGVILRVHGIYMDRRRHFEIRTNAAGQLELWDAELRQRWDRKMEAARDKVEHEQSKRLEKEEKERAKEKEKEKPEKEQAKSGWGSTLRRKLTSKKGNETDGETTDEGDDDGDSTSIMLDQEKEGEVKVLERKPTVKERLEGLVQPQPGPSAAGTAEPIHTQDQERGTEVKPV